MHDDLFTWAERPAPSAPAPAERSYGSDDKSHRARVLELLGDGEWHSSRALGHVGGTRYGSRVQELRELGYLIDCRHREEAPAGVYEWRLSGQGEPPPKRRSWKERALAAEARVLELEAQLGGT
jgi:hypothetical protein